MKRFLHNLFGKKPSATVRKSGPAKRLRLQLEQLDDRIVLLGAAEDEFVISYADVVSIDQFESAVTFDLLSINLDSVCAAPVVDEIASIFAFQQRMMS